MGKKYLYHDKEAGCWRRPRDSTPVRVLRRLSNEAYEYCIEEDENRYFVFCIRRAEAEDWIGTAISQAKALNLISLDEQVAIREIRRVFCGALVFL